MPLPRQRNRISRDPSYTVRLLSGRGHLTTKDMDESRGLLSGLVVLVGSALNPALPDLAPLGRMLAVTQSVGRQVYRRQPSPIL